MTDAHMRIKILDIDYVQRIITCSQVNDSGQVIGALKRLQERTRERVSSYHVAGDVVDIWVDRPQSLSKVFGLGHVSITQMTYPRIRMDETAARIIETMRRDEGDTRKQEEILEDFILDTGPISTNEFTNGPYSRRYQNKDYTIWICGKKGIVRGDFGLNGDGIQMTLKENILTISNCNIPDGAVVGAIGKDVCELVEHPWLVGKITQIEKHENDVTKVQTVRMTLRIPEHVIPSQERAVLDNAV